MPIDGISVGIVRHQCMLCSAEMMKTTVLSSIKPSLYFCEIVQKKRMISQNDSLRFPAELADY